MAAHNPDTKHHDPAPYEDRCACQEYRELSRRNFMGGSATAALSVALSAVLPRVVLGGGSKKGNPSPKTLVFVFLRGGPDSLARLVPWTDPWYYAPQYDNGHMVFPDGLRPTIGINPPSVQSYEYPNILDRCIELGEVGGDHFGINEAYADPEWIQGQTAYGDRDGLYDAFGDGDVAFVTAAGSPDDIRSHFQAEQRVEYATPNQPQSIITGFLARYLAARPDLGNPLRGAALSTNRLMPKILALAERTIPFEAISEVVFPGSPDTIAGLLARYDAQADEPLRSGVLNFFQIVDLLADVDTTPNPAAKYNDSEFGERLRNAAALIKAGIEIEAIYVDRIGWDNHSQQRAHHGQGGMYDRLKDISQNLAAFRVDLQLAGKWDDVVVVEQGEFGRQNNENGNYGTDHGNGGMMTVMGGQVNGGIYSQRFDGSPGWPGLDPVELANHGQYDAMPTTIDYRWILTEIMHKSMGLDLATIQSTVFPSDVENPPYEYQELGIIA